VVTLYDGRRGCEKIENLRRDQWEKVHDDVWDFSFWQKVSMIFLKLHFTVSFGWDSFNFNSSPDFFLKIGS